MVTDDHDNYVTAAYKYTGQSISLPVAKKRSVIANRSAGVMLFLSKVSCRCISGLTFISKMENDSLSILKKFLYDELSDKLICGNSVVKAPYCGLKS